MDEDEIIKYLNNIIEKLSMNINVSPNELRDLEAFLNNYIKIIEEGRIVTNYSISSIFDKFLYVYNNYNIQYTDTINNIMKRFMIIRDKTDSGAMGYDKGNVKKLSNTPKNYHSIMEDELTPLNKAAFITTAFILEATVVITFILSLLALVKE